MARDFAKSFYNSQKWKRARQLCISRNHGICERCGKAFASKQLIVHHKVHLSQENITNENISLSQDNLECVCKFCHNEEHLKNTNRVIYFDENGNICYVRDKQSE